MLRATECNCIVELQKCCALLNAILMLSCEILSAAKCDFNVELQECCARLHAILMWSCKMLRATTCDMASVPSFQVR